MSFDPKGQYLLFNSTGRREVFLQAGRMYNTKGQDLYDQYVRDKERFPEGDNRKNWTIIDWINHNRYAMNAELRTRMIEQQVAESQKEELERLQAKAQQMRAQMMAESEAELFKHQSELEAHLLPAVPESPEAPPIKPAFLTSVEQKLFGNPEPTARPAEDPFEDILSDDTSDFDSDVSVGGVKLNPATKPKSTTIKAKVSRR